MNNKFFSKKDIGAFFLAILLTTGFIVGVKSFLSTKIQKTGISKSEIQDNPLLQPKVEAIPETQPQTQPEKKSEAQTILDKSMSQEQKDLEAYNDAMFNQNKELVLSNFKSVWDEANYKREHNSMYQKDKEFSAMEQKIKEKLAEYLND